MEFNKFHITIALVIKIIGIGIHYLALFAIYLCIRMLINKSWPFLLRSEYVFIIIEHIPSSEM